MFSGSLTRLSLIVISLLLIIAFQTETSAQSVIIHSIVIKGGDVQISYSLMDNNINNKYTLNLYSSIDDYAKPLREVEGEIGLNLSVGNNKKLIWHASKEYGEKFKGDVAFEIKGDLYVPFIKLSNFENFEELKRKRPYRITWTTSNESDVLNWNLLNEKREVVHSFSGIENVGDFELIIPKKIKPGKGYYLLVSDPNNNDNLVKTPTFQIIRKNPAGFKFLIIGAGLGLGFVAYEFLLKDTGADPVEPPSGFGDPVIPSN